MPLCGLSFGLRSVIVSSSFAWSPPGAGFLPPFLNLNLKPQTQLSTFPRRHSCAALKARRNLSKHQTSLKPSIYACFLTHPFDTLHRRHRPATGGTKGERAKSRQGGETPRRDEPRLIPSPPIPPLHPQPPTFSPSAVGRGGFAGDGFRACRRSHAAAAASIPLTKGRHPGPLAALGGPFLAAWLPWQGSALDRPFLGPSGAFLRPSWLCLHARMRACLRPESAFSSMLARPWRASSGGTSSLMSVPPNGNPPLAVPFLGAGSGRLPSRVRVNHYTFVQFLRIGRATRPGLPCAGSVTLHIFLTSEKPQAQSPLMDIRSGSFVDWLSLSQHHPGGCPVVNDGELLRIKADGEPDWVCSARLKVPGSFDSSCYVTSDGHTVKFTGNPSRWCRPDNVFGFDLAGCVQVVNTLLASLGLPPFTAGQYVPDELGAEGIRRAFWTGARVSRIDITRNYEAGSDADARGVLAFLQRQQISGSRGGLLGETTVQFMAGRRQSFKLYLKGPELKAHAKPDASPAAAAVQSWATDCGLLRAELTLRSTQLAHIGAAWLGDLLEGQGMKRVVHELDRRTEVLNRQAEVKADPLAGLPRPVEATARRYMMGVNVRETLPLSTFYKHRKALLHLFDIAVPPPHKIEPPVRPIVLRPAVAPEWYSFARTPCVIPVPITGLPKPKAA